jgi:predicted N-acetyltransferase YhbS
MVGIWMGHADRLDLVFRAYTPADEPAVLSLWRQAFGTPGDHNAASEVIRRKVAAQPELFRVALVADELVGTVMAGYDGHRGWISRVAVDARWRHRGIGAALLQHAESLLLALDCPKVILFARDGDPGVVEFYGRSGYMTEPRVCMAKYLRG